MDLSDPATYMEFERRKEVYEDEQAKLDRFTDRTAKDAENDPQWWARYADETMKKCDQGDVAAVEAVGTLYHICKQLAALAEQRVLKP